MREYTYAGAAVTSGMADDDDDDGTLRHLSKDV